MFDTQQVDATFNFTNSLGTRIIPAGIINYKLTMANLGDKTSEFDLLPDPGGDTKVTIAAKAGQTPVGNYTVSATPANFPGVTINIPTPLAVSRDPAVPTGGNGSLGTPVPRTI